MGFVAHSPPNYAAAEAAYGIAQGPIKKAAFVGLPLASKVNGIMNMVFAYGGAMIVSRPCASAHVQLDGRARLTRACAAVPGDARGDAPPVGLLEGHVLRAAAHLLRVHAVWCADPLLLWVAR